MPHKIIPGEKKYVPWSAHQHHFRAPTFDHRHQCFFRAPVLHYIFPEEKCLLIRAPTIDPRHQCYFPRHQGFTFKQHQCFLRAPASLHFTLKKNISWSAHQRLTLDTRVTSLDTNVSLSSSTSVFSAHQCHYIFPEEKHLLIRAPTIDPRHQGYFPRHQRFNRAQVSHYYCPDPRTSTLPSAPDFLSAALLVSPRTS